MVITTMRFSWQRTSNQIEIRIQPDRNDSCGSGKKYKRCCGGARVN